MKYRIPKKDDVSSAIQNIITTHKIINSQRKFTCLVNKKLSEIEPRYRVSGERLRTIVFDSSFISIEIIARESDIKKRLAKCPVCGFSLRPLRNETIYGGTVTLGFACIRCPYWTGIKRRVPTRYIFTICVERPSL